MTANDNLDGNTQGVKSSDESILIKQREQLLKDIDAHQVQCTYCSELANTINHMNFPVCSSDCYN